MHVRRHRLSKHSQERAHRLGVHHPANPRSTVTMTKAHRPIDIQVVILVLPRRRRPLIAFSPTPCDRALRTVTGLVLEVRQNTLAWVGLCHLGNPLGRLLLLLPCLRVVLGVFGPGNQMAVAQAMKQRAHPVKPVNHTEILLDDLSDVPAKEDAPRRFESRTGVEDLGELLPLVGRKPVRPAARRLGCLAG